MSALAIVGYACRFPGGADSPEKFWELLAAGRDAVSEIPDERWDKAHFLHPDPREPGRAYTFRAGVLDDVAGFDCGFFNISPREAEQMDPQQRMLLELTWEALERGGIVPDRLAGTRCSVHVGISSTDYADIRQGDPATADAFFMTGSTLSIAANRISYLLDLRGPSVAVDTACSSALFALDDAWRQIREGRADMAIVGAVSLLLSPYPFIGFSKATMLSPYGQCRAFDATADGYVRGEGGGVLVVRKLADAERDGDPIFAVLRGIATNADGRTMGIAQPSAATQEELLREVYRASRVRLRDVAYVEAHGTGTSVGDPVEAASVGRAIALRRPGREPLHIGSAKTNIGHLEPASGMAGLIKAIEVLRHGVIPPSLHVERLNPQIDFDGLNLRVARCLTDLPATDGPPVVGVNSFGFGGTNAHAILQAWRPAPARPRKAAPLPDETAPLLLSARSEPALRALAGGIAHHMRRHPRLSAGAVAATLALHRAQHDYRVAARGAGRDDLLARLDGLAAAEAAVGGRADFAGGRTAFVFAGNGAQWLGMGRRLLDGDAAFRATIEAIDALTRVQAGLSVIEELRADEESSRLAEAPVAQPLIFAVQAAAADALIARGLVADAVVGHSVGEVAAAYVARALSLEQAVEVIVRRSAVQERTRGLGTMAAAELDEARAAELIAPYGGRIELAAVNAPGSVTLTGERDALAELGARLPGRRTAYTLLDFEYPFHSRHLDPYRDEAVASLAGLVPSSGPVAFYSTVTGGPVEGSALDPAYWWDNMRQPVRFADAVAAMAADGCTLFVEISAHAIMQAYVRRSLRGCDGHGRPLPTLRRDRDGPEALDAAADAAWEAGARLDLERLFPDPGPVADLPTYPWQRESCWIKPGPDAFGQIYLRTEGAMLGGRLTADLRLWQGQLDEALHPFLADHVVGGAILLPATGFAELAAEAAVAARGDGPVVIEDLEIRQPMVLDPARRKLVRVALADDGTIEISARTRLTEESWTSYAVARAPADAGVPEAFTPPELSDAPRAVRRAEAHYALAARLGLSYGPLFRTVRRIEVHADDVARVELTLPDGLDDAGRFVLHPALFDGCLQGLFGLLRDAAGEGPLRAFLPTRIERLVVAQPGAVPASCVIRLAQASDTGLLADFVIRDEDDAIVAEARGFRFQRAYALERRAGGVYFYDEVPLAPLTARHAGISPALRPAATDEGDPGPALDALAGAFAAAALRRIQHEAGDDGAGADADRLPLLEHCLTLAVEAGALDPDDPDGAVADGGDPMADWRALLAERPDTLAEATALGRAGLHLAEILRGRDCAELLPSAATLELLQGGAPSAAPAVETILRAVRTAVESAPADRRLRIVELGGGLLATRLKRALSRDRVSYAVAEFAGAPAAPVGVALPVDPDIERRTIDPAKPLGPDNGWAAGSIDLIVGAQGPAVPPLAPGSATLLRGLLAPDGALLLSAPRPASWLDLAFGVFDGWWQTDGDDARSPLRDGEDWRGLLTAAGFEGAEVAEAGGFYAIAARAPRNAAPPTTSDARVLLLCGDGADGGAGPADLLADALRARGASVSIARPADTEVGWDDLWAARRDAGEAPMQVVYLTGVGRPPAGPDDLPGHVEACCGAAVLMARTLARAGFAPKPALVLATGPEDRLAGAALRGLGRVIQNEYADLGTRLVELQDAAAAPAALAGKLADEILFGGDEDEVRLGPDRRSGLRLRRQPEPAPAAAAGETHLTLGFTPGSLESLAWVRAPSGPLPPGAVEIAVRATGLNFRDVMYAMGVLSADIVEHGFAGATLGLEAAGDVVAVAPDVTGFSAGDRVFCFGPQCFAQRVVVDARAVSRVPAGLDYEAAATIPAVFFTAHYALSRLARLERGERILIHGAAGGVGLAAIQIARHLGAEIYATAGTPEKRDIVRLMGVPEDNIFSSRDGDFDARLMEATGGEGVDLVLNSLYGEGIRKGLRCLRPFGRFVELGKRDFQLDTRVGLRPFRENISYFAVDADQLMAEKPALARDLLAELVALFESGVLRPLPRRVFAHDDIVGAFRHMQHSQHIGKIVVAMPGGAAEAASAAEADAGPAPFAIAGEGSCLIAGGTAGFGLATARWLAERGARDLVLLSRRGSIADGDRKTVETMRAAGARVDAVACDVTDAAALAALIGRLDAEGRPPRGVIHAAAVFDDAMLAGMTPEQLHRVLAPKVAGGWALHRATEHRALDFFIMYSSVATLFGNPGQGAYVAANAFLEALAEHRRARGLPGTAVCWSAIADAGYLTRAGEVRDAMEGRFGITAMAARRALDALPRLAASEGGAATVVDFDPASLVRRLPTAGSARYRDIAGRRGGASEGERGHDFERLLAQGSPEEIKQLLVELLTAETAKVLRLAPDRIDSRRSIFDLGMDSLMGLELMIGLEDALGVKLPAMSLGGDSSIFVLAERIYGIVDNKGVNDLNVGVEDSAVSDLLDRHDAAVSEQDLAKIVGELDTTGSKRAV